MAQPRRTSKQSKQAGGTFLGIVLGLIVGLAIAVVVALYITRSPSPFVSKVAPPPADNAASQPQQFDPNRALQGKTPGQPVPQA
ncbi:cell division protein, partial [Burkholderia contaminans]